MADDETFLVGAPLPRFSKVSVDEGFRLMITWVGQEEGTAPAVIDLAPAIFRYRIDAPLRDDPDLFRTARITDDGFAIAWDLDELDLSSTTVADLAEQAMSPSDFSAFVKRNGYTLDSVAAESGISRRPAADYAKEREIPRHIALACRYLDQAGVGPSP